jgi:hypothetical protein
MEIKADMKVDMENKAELFSALAKAQAMMPIAGMSSSNPFFKSKYADLTELVRASRPVLTRHGLCVSQYLDQDDIGTFLVTLLGHSSGQSLISRVKIAPQKPDIQSFGSYISYMKRYCYAAIVGIVTSDEDDDGESAMVRGQTQPQPQGDVISKDQLALLDSELDGHKDIAQDILKKMNLKRLADMPRMHFMAAIKRIQEIKALKKER